MEKTQLRIVAGSLRGRKIQAMVHEGMRPTPQMVREALFSILGNAVPDRLFVDVFSGTGVNGMEAISRGASMALFVERDARLATSIEKYLREFGVIAKSQVFRTDVYRWAERWRAGSQPVNVFLSPPFPDLTDRAADFERLVRSLQSKLAFGSVLTIQVEDTFSPKVLPDAERWELRKYGRNLLMFWEPPEIASASSEPTPDQSTVS